MEKFCASSNPQSVPSNSNVSTSLHDDPALLEGVAAEVKLLLKLIHDHNAASRETDVRRPKRLATMLTILDGIRSRVQKAQARIPKRKAELRRCATELFRNNVDNSDNKEKEAKPTLSPSASGRNEEEGKLRRQLSANMTARKGLEKMFCSLSKEKEMIAAELAKRVHEATLMEEEISDLRKQNEKLMEKAKVCAAQHQEGVNDTAGDGGGGGGGGGGGDAAALQERNGELTEQLMRSLEAYRTVKRRLREVMDERERINGRIADVAMEAAAGFERVRRLRERVGRGGGYGGDGGVGEELCMLERVFAGFYRRLMMGVAVPPRGASPRGSPSRAEQN